MSKEIYAEEGLRTVSYLTIVASLCLSSTAVVGLRGEVITATLIGGLVALFYYPLGVFLHYRALNGKRLSGRDGPYSFLCDPIVFEETIRTMCLLGLVWFVAVPVAYSLSMSIDTLLGLVATGVLLCVAYLPVAIRYRIRAEKKGTSLGVSEWRRICFFAFVLGSVVAIADSLGDSFSQVVPHILGLSAFTAGLYAIGRRTLVSDAGDVKR